MATGGFVCELSVAILMLISVWNGTTPNPQEEICLLTFVTGVALGSESEQVRGSYSGKTCAWAVED